MKEEFIFEWLQEFLFPWFLLYFEQGYVPAFGNREEGGGRVRNGAINKPAQDNPLLWAFLLWHMLIYSRVQHIEVDCFGCSCSWFLAPVLTSGALGRVHLLPSSWAQCRGSSPASSALWTSNSLPGTQGKLGPRWGGRAVSCQGDGGQGRGQH